VEFGFEKEDARTPLVISGVDGVTLDGFKTQKSSSGDSLRLMDVKNLTVRNSPGSKDRKNETVEKGAE